MGRRGAGDGTVRHRAGAPEGRHQESDSCGCTEGRHPAVSGKSGQLVQSHDGGRLYRLHPDRGYLRAGGHRSADGKERFL